MPKSPVLRVANVFRHALVVGACASALASFGGTARAHGTIPAPNTVTFGPGAGGGLFGTNFGGIWQAAVGGPYAFMCETLVTGEPRSLDAWLWLGSGRFVAAATSGSFAFGIFGSTDTSGCAFVELPGTADLTVTELIADPDDGTAYLATGRNDPPVGNGGETGRVLRGTPDAAAPTVLFERAGYTVTGVRTRAGHLYASVVSLTTIGESILIHSADEGAHWDEYPETLGAGEAIAPIGIAPSNGLTVWVVHTSDAGDALRRSTDGGAHFETVLTLAARITAFAANADASVVWVQSPTKGVYRSEDGGTTFASLVGSPHGSCLTYASGALYACGVPWQDGMAFGVSTDGKTFTARVTKFDEIADPIACADPAVTQTCRDELDFLRDYYGFATPTKPDGDGDAGESGPESSAETVTEADGVAVESGPDEESPVDTGHTPDTTGATTTDASPTSAADSAQTKPKSGCAGGSGDVGTGALAGLVATVGAAALSARRRRETSR